MLCFFLFLSFRSNQLQLTDVPFRSSLPLPEAPCRDTRSHATLGLRIALASPAAHRPIRRRQHSDHCFWPHHLKRHSWVRQMFQNKDHKAIFGFTCSMLGRRTVDSSIIHEPNTDNSLDNQTPVECSRRRRTMEFQHDLSVGAAQHVYTKSLPTSRTSQVHRPRWGA